MDFRTIESVRRSQSSIDRNKHWVKFSQPNTSNKNYTTRAIIFLQIVKLPFDRTFDFDLGAEKYRGRATDFQCHLGLFRIMLNVCRVAGRYGRILLLGCAWFRIAHLLHFWLPARAQFLAPFNFVLLGHDLFAFNATLFKSTAARSIEIGGMFYYFSISESEYGFYFCSISILS